MQDRPLMISSLIDYAATFHGDTELVSRLPEGPIRRTTWREVNERSKQVANALAELGIEQGDRIATLAWNSDRHLALYFGVSGSGAVMHTVNPRLFPGQIAFILADAQDTHLLVDPTLLPVLEGLADRLPPSLRAVVVMGDEAQLPAASKLAMRTVRTLVLSEDFTVWIAAEV